MAKMQNERMDRAGRRADKARPQQGDIQGGSDARQQQQQDPRREESGGLGTGRQGEGGQRHRDGSSRDPRQQG